MIVSSMIEQAPRFNLIYALELVVLTLCPPGPEERIKLV